MKETLRKIKEHANFKKVSFSVIGLSLIFNFILLIYVLGNLGAITFTDNFDKAQKQYPLLSKRVLQDSPQDLLINFLDLRNDLKQKTAPYGNSFALYFEYLPTGTSVAINATNEFHAASLFKLPVIMAFYHANDRLHRGNNPEITLTKDMLDNQFGDLWKKGAGYKLKASDAVKMALENSDNTAARSLVPLIDTEDFNMVYQGLDIDLSSDKEGAILTAKNYSSILKSLYFSSVLEKDDSEEILNYLSKTKFPDKLAAGVPQNVTVAHKIGDFNDNAGNEAFTDCGIVYVPRRAYILCMLSVSDEQAARTRMSSVSKTIYDFVSQAQ